MWRLIDNKSISEDDGTISDEDMKVVAVPHEECQTREKYNNIFSFYTNTKNIETEYINQPPKHTLQSQHRQTLRKEQTNKKRPW